MNDDLDAPASVPEKARTCQELAVEVERLRNAVTAMDCLSQAVHTEIIGLARVVVACLESPDGAMHHAAMISTLETLIGRADDVENCINAEAENVGCNYIDEVARAKDARMSAFRRLASEGGPA